MSKAYRDKKKRCGSQSIHKGRHVHQLDEEVPIAQLIDEIRAGGMI